MASEEKQHLNVSFSSGKKYHGRLDVERTGKRENSSERKKTEPII